MKSKKIICLVLVILMMILTFNINSYAITLPWLEISSYNYSNGDKMTQNETKEVEIGKTLQLRNALDPRPVTEYPIVNELILHS